VVIAVLVLLAATACGSGQRPSAASQRATSKPATSNPATTKPAGPHPGTAGGTTVIIKDFTYHPASLTVKPGVTVTVENEDSVAHTVTAVAPHQGAFNTADINAGATKSFTAPSTPGTYPYICLIHQFMHGTLVVS
jgi:plastocyanin